MDDENAKEAPEFGHTCRELAGLRFFANISMGRGLAGASVYAHLSMTT